MLQDNHTFLLVKRHAELFVKRGGGNTDVNRKGEGKSFGEHFNAYNKQELLKRFATNYMGEEQ